MPLFFHILLPPSHIQWLLTVSATLPHQKFTLLDPLHPPQPLVAYHPQPPFPTKECRSLADGYLGSTHWLQSTSKLLKLRCEWLNSIVFEATTKTTMAVCSKSSVRSMCQQKVHVDIKLFENHNGTKVCSSAVPCWVIKKKYTDVDIKVHHFHPRNEYPKTSLASFHTP